MKPVLHFFLFALILMITAPFWLSFIGAVAVIIASVMGVFLFMGAIFCAWLMFEYFRGE